MSRGAPGYLNAQHCVPGHCPRHTLLLVCSLALQSQEAGGEKQWRLVRKPLPGRTKRKKNHFLLNQWCPTVQPLTLSLCSHLCSKWLNASSWAPSLSPPTFCLPHSPKPVVFSTLRWHRHPFHLSNYIHFQTDVLWQSYKALTSFFKINEILP